ncbi:fumarylacetoacetate hydrolase family protein [Plantactinospora sp. WMMB334]|uniref:fumarylacetoacetate hydrolase family protein n=1 Tax=Plantactinospora sp. WMMB334 TaxID=3404119 RepID=UPI003B94A484
MKLLTYRRAGAVRHGWLADDRTVGELGDGDLSTLLGTGTLAGSDRPAGWPAGQRYPLAEVEVLAPLLRPGKLLGVAANYQDHVTESGAPPLDRSTLAPRLFLMPPTAIVGPDAPIPMPAVSDEIDWEAELGVVIGRVARDVPVGTALDAVAGYCVANDVSARSMRYGFARDRDAAVTFFDWLAGKWLDGFAPYGPWLVTADEIGDPQDLTIELTVNGVTRQRGSTKDMIFSVAELVSFASRLMTLEPGDVLMTGTPAGVGATTGEFLAVGDEMTVRVEGLGSLTNRIVAAARPGISQP